MLNYYSEEQKVTKIRELAEEYRNAAELFPIIRPVIESFDGKVFNCRLDKALRELFEKTGRYICARREYGALKIYYYETTYHGSAQFMLASIPESKLPEGKRIPAADLINSAREQRESNLKVAASLDENIAVMQTTKKQIEYLVSQINRIVDPLPSAIQDIYGFRHVYGL